MEADAILENWKSPYLGRGTSDFDKIWHIDAVRPSWLFLPLKIWKTKFQDGDGRYLEKSKNRHISATVPALSTKYGTMAQFDLFDRSFH